MSVYGMFQPSVLGMQSQSHALSTISTNIANVRTGGYKRVDTTFSTVLSATVSNSAALGRHSDLGGVRPIDSFRIGEQGIIEASTSALDVAISGDGFFVLNTQVDGGGDTYFTRDGSLAIATAGTATAPGIGGGTITVEQGYLVDKNGYFLQGWAPLADGSFPTDAGALQSMRVDTYAFSNAADPTNLATLTLNIPANDPAGALETYAIEVIDSAGAPQSLLLRFEKSSTANTWNFDIAGGTGDAVTTTPAANFTYTPGAGQEAVFNAGTNGIQIRDSGSSALVQNAFTTLTPGDTITVTGTAGNNGSYTVATVAADGSTITVDPATPIPLNETITTAAFTGVGVLAQPLSFLSTGTLTGSGQYAVNVAHSGGSTSSFTLDLSQITQFAGDMTVRDYNHDGFAQSDLRSLEFDAEGTVIGRFGSGMTMPLYRVALGVFPNADALGQANGNVFWETADSGSVRIEQAGTQGVAVLLPNSHELSNVDLAEEFAEMIVTQATYNASATAYRTVDEMTELARDLKR